MNLPNSKDNSQRARRNMGRKGRRRFKCRASRCQWCRLRWRYDSWGNRWYISSIYCKWSMSRRWTCKCRITCCSSCRIRWRYDSWGDRWYISYNSIWTIYNIITININSCASYIRCLYWRRGIWGTTCILFNHLSVLLQYLIITDL